MQISTTTLSDNLVGGTFPRQIGLGGAICNGATLAIVNSTITRNTTSGTFQSGGIGGGIFNDGILAIVNTTISGNLAVGAGGFPGNGGGIGNGSGNVVIQNSTITNNMADGPSRCGLGGNVFIAAGTLEMGSTILNNASGGNIFNFGKQGTVISDGYNLTNDDGAGYLIAAGDQINANPRLGPLQDNGGPTLTHALLADSPAIDAGDPNFNLNNFQPPLIYDQRGLGFERVKNGRRDIGALEVQTAPITPPRPTPPPPPPRPSPTPSPSPSLTPPPPQTPTATPTNDPRKAALANVRRDMRFTRMALQKLNGTTSTTPSIFEWLKVRLRALKARLAYPEDEVLARIDRQLLNTVPTDEASTRKLLGDMNARLNALRSGR
jgi:hypothetical protein